MEESQEAEKKWSVCLFKEQLNPTLTFILGIR